MFAHFSITSGFITNLESLSLETSLNRTENPNGLTRIFTYSDLTPADISATLCIQQDQSGFVDMFNGKCIALDKVSRAIFEYQVRTGKAISGGLLWTCDEFGEKAVSQKFESALEVEGCVVAEAGQGLIRG